MEFETYIRFILVLVFVLGLVLLLAWVLRRFGFGGAMGKLPGRRLGIVETMLLGPKHRMILVRRDEVEHLIVIGPTGEAVVETGIRRPATPKPAEAATAQRFEPMLQASIESGEKDAAS